MKLFDTSLTRLQESLDVRLVEHNVLAGNIANSDTPGYKPKELDFSQAMAAAQQAANAGTLAATDQRHMGVNGASADGTGISRATSAATTLVRDGGGTSPSIDGNQVDLDRTMAGLAENSLQYGASARAAGKKLAILRYVVSDGGG
ncbi:MAG: flagellar basal body rod protein FlgB [Deltaproteobacteria bacterium]|nr:flagellar basal body rod protein FlgB [Deltaproteobacteria bacterium]